MYITNYIKLLFLSICVDVQVSKGHLKQQHLLASYFRSSLSLTRSSTLSHNKTYIRGIHLKKRWFHMTYTRRRNKNAVLFLHVPLRT